MIFNLMNVEYWNLEDIWDHHWYPVEIYQHLKSLRHLNERILLIESIPVWKIFSSLQCSFLSSPYRIIGAISHVSVLMSLSSSVYSSPFLRACGWCRIPWPWYKLSFSLSLFCSIYHARFSFSTCQWVSVSSTMKRIYIYINVNNQVDMDENWISFYLGLIWS